MSTEILQNSTNDVMTAELENTEQSPTKIIQINEYIPEKNRLVQRPKTYSTSAIDALSAVLFEGNSTGDQILYKDADDTVKTTDVLSSNLYLLQQSEDGTIRAFFDQYCAGYQGDDGYGILHPHTVQQKEIEMTHDNRIYEVTKSKTLGWTGNETRRILEVRYDASTGEVSRNYKKRKDFRYAFEDVRRLKEVREQLKTAYVNHSVPRVDTHENEEVMPENAAAD